ncbi:MAG: hypothetical protein HN509_00625 [Halobacteriovoraceae bacterium]|jgi:hypothetical protein|nr:hypothetical protein [Halobacteriovoraceae bacterium]MBT5095446.1 hypothetical protein [Halobacteriovoraceae bacterium]
MKNLFLLFMFLGLVCSASAKDPAKKLKRPFVDKALIKKGTSFFRRLLCPDGSLARFSGVDTIKSDLGQVEDHYSIICNDGTKAKYIINNLSLPKKPLGFKLLDRDAVAKYWESRRYYKGGDKNAALKSIEEALGLEPKVELFLNFKKTIKK